MSSPSISGDAFAGKPAHTPGPWQSDGIGRVIAVGHHKGLHGAWQRDVCSLRDRTNDLATAAADTNLIAAAPDMFEALLKVRTDLLRTDFPSAKTAEEFMLRYIDAAIAKARA
jgi:hypothetical protein